MQVLKTVLSLTYTVSMDSLASVNFIQTCQDLQMHNCDAQLQCSVWNFTRQTRRVKSNLTKSLNTVSLAKHENHQLPFIKNETPRREPLEGQSTRLLYSLLFDAKGTGRKKYE
ncbi:hypothetical protein RUM43_004820 [Polyplax serrata]|uniref:Uncharacterized protein n=1 Tax=Polyplax serrata TaxID=468196 RepID=A0AAN8XMJ1_POLSC